MLGELPRHAGALHWSLSGLQTDSVGLCYTAFTGTVPYKVPITHVPRTPGPQGGVISIPLCYRETEGEKILRAGGRQSQDPVMDRFLCQPDWAQGCADSR